VKRDLMLLALATLCIAATPTRGSADDEKESRLRFWGDLRGRYEGFWFRLDETGSERTHRSRIRYRFRLNMNAGIHDHAKVEAQLATGDVDNRSGNQTLGSPVDFGTNEIDLRRAYLIYYPFENGGLGEQDGGWEWHFGRVANPFLWKNGKDLMLWDSDINPAGLSTKFDIEFETSTTLFANAGYYVVDENGSARDPILLAVQAGVKQGISKSWNGGARLSYYAFDHLDAAFIDRGVSGVNGVTSGGGNTKNGLTGDPNGGNVHVLETQLFLQGKPQSVGVFGGYSNNLSAGDPSPAVSKQPVAFNVGAQVGNKKRSYGRIGLVYVWIEADAFPSQFIDSDLLDGRTNRKGGLLYYSRNIVKGIDFNFQVFVSDAIEANITNPDESVANSERTRSQIDLVYSF
jgi:hypothetical protein